MLAAVFKVRSVADKALLVSDWSDDYAGGVLHGGASVKRLTGIQSYVFSDWL